MHRYSASKLIVEPLVEPVTPAELGAHLRLEQPAIDAEIANGNLEAFVVAARQHAEEATSRAFINQTWQVAFDSGQIMQIGSSDDWWDGVRDGAISQNVLRNYDLPKSPLVSISSFKYYSETDAETVYPSSNYLADTLSTPGRVAIKPGVSAPTPTRGTNAVIVEYIAGYGLTAASVPAPLKLAIKLMAAHWYENREVVSSDTNVVAGVVPLGAVHILRRFKVAKL